MHLDPVSLECRHISLSYGSNEVLRDVNLKIEPGEFFALLGPSGSGKSTLLRLIAGFNRHQRGELLVGGQDITGVPPHARNIGMVFQNYALWPHMTVYDNVAFGLVERRESRDTIRRKVGEVLELVGLSQYAQRRPGQLSGGQQQRVALARTVVIAPKLLLLDEPLSNLDKQLRVQMREELRSLQRKLGLTTIFVTHDQEEAMTTADRMAVLDKGVLQQVGSAAGLYDYPANRFVAGFVGTANVLEGEVLPTTGESLVFKVPGLGTLTLPRPAQPPVPGRAALAFRPHQVQIAVRDDAGDASRVWVEGQIESAEFLGEFSRYRVRVGEVAVVADQAHYAGIAMFPMGMPVRLGIEPTQLRYLDE
ncbi:MULTISPECIES: ABC transporter ATP-binding protein [Delftia]|jgi:iron(III) transport system ATP-binding protein|uniref:ABC transporter ATP-binding protein n=4 Tax=Burkholderiales TaxID=80840 RepID=A0ABN4SVI0_9BURK|nr:ABC transporter ATP-binding protein [Delftia tsuruhatensis]EPD36577.1 iron(III) transport system ATP-binding protein [Delftia acidovorans CCUG 274B]EPD46979.1 iron(III) transport system ATP-binding protein [Delftia acidovorans CCUG 15835]MBS3721080.1 Maltose/maltodextrin import ATP-binding protein MalK [Delftia sp. PE138]MDR6732092.1 iron(III) transport system ATP-binding protein [Delftia lacustris]PZP70629.1 MAG: ABC transporter ATP-binding protein [Delftia acidovorans]